MELKQKDNMEGGAWAMGPVDFVYSRCIPTIFQGFRHVVIFIGTILSFWFGEKTLGIEWEIHGFGYGFCGLVLGLHTHKESLI